ncbi:MAG: ABC transporter permease [Cytophagales bacterium]|nr:ABC transporter permease [Cytophagales bacterium]
MNRLLRIEIRKLKNSASFWVLSGLYALMFVFAVYTIQNFTFDFNFNGNTINGGVRQFMVFPSVWQNMAWLASFFRILLAIIVITSIGNEYMFRTFRQGIINGMSRTEFVLGKVLAILLFSLSAMVLIFVVGASIGLANSSSASRFFDHFEYIPAIGLATLGYLLFAAVLVFFLKKSALSIALLLAYSYVIEPLLAWRLDGIGRYLPLKVFDRLNTFPYKDSVPGMNWEAPLVYPEDVAVSVVWIGLFVLVLLACTRKMEIR